MYSRSFYSNDRTITINCETDQLISTVDDLDEPFQYARESVAAIS